MTDPDKIAQFTAVTGVSEDAAKFYLDSSSGDLETAVNQFYATGGVPEAPESAEDFMDAPEESQPEPPARPERPSAPASAPATAAASVQPGGSNRSGAARAGNVRSLADLGGAGDDSDDGQNEYYAGGEKSGQVVKGGPPTSSDDVFERARKAGAQEGALQAQSQGGRSGAFSGRGRTLAGDAPPEDARPAPAQVPEQTVHTITFYTNGIFTVDDGPARQTSDPANRDLLGSVSRGECPHELEPADRRTKVVVNLARSAQEYQEPEKPRYTAFTGTGRTLTADAPSTSAPGQSSSAAPPVTPSSSVQWEGPDLTQDTTTVMVCLADGARQKVQFNLTQTVADIRRFIRASQPGSAATGYRLVTAHPRSELSDDSATIGQAGLANAVVRQEL